MCAVSDDSSERRKNIEAEDSNHAIMEGNRDEAERCIAIAVQAVRDAKIEKAEKFLRKAEKLYPSQKAKGNSIFKEMCLNMLAYV